MFQGIVLYLSITNGAFIGWVLVPIYPFFLFFIMLIILFLINVVFSFLAIKKTTMSYALEKEVLIRNQKVVLHLTRNMNQIVPIGKIICDYYQEIGQEKKKCQIDNRTLHQNIELSAIHCGVSKITVYNEYYFDVLHILYAKRKQNIIKEIIILPVIKTINYELLPLKQVGDVNGGKYQKGEDHSETFDIRKYQQGDTLRHIHWKLSMKKNELLVKAGSQLFQTEIMITYVVDSNADKNDQTLDILHSMCTIMNADSIAYTIGIYDSIGVTVKKYDIINEEDYLQVLYKIVTLLKNPWTKEHIYTCCPRQAMYIVENNQITIIDDEGGMTYEKISLSS